MNKVFLNGYLARDPQQRITSKGLEQSNITVAVNDIKNYNETHFIPCVSWGVQAKYINSNLKKGSFVAIDGRLSVRNYVTNEGQTRYVTEVIIDNVRNFGNRRTSEESETTNNGVGNSSFTSGLSSSNRSQTVEDGIHANLDDVFATDTYSSKNDDIEELDWDDDLN